MGRTIIQHVFYALGGLLTFFLMSVPAHANELPQYGVSTLSSHDHQLIEGFLGIKIDPPQVARVDLNQDGLDEFVIKTDKCNAADQACAFLFLAETSGKMYGLGEINARGVLIGNETKNGVRNILAFQNDQNDYDYQIYVWEPIRAQYILRE